MIFARLSPHEVDTYWNTCKRILEPAFRARVHTDCADDYYAPLKDGDFQMWIAAKEDRIIGVAVTCLEAGTVSKVCTILSLAGEEFKEWANPFRDKITEFAKENGCYAIEAVTRRGFEKYAESDEWVEDGVVYVKILGDKNV